MLSCLRFRRTQFRRLSCVHARTFLIACRAGVYLWQGLASFLALDTCKICFWETLAQYAYDNF